MKRGAFMLVTVLLGPLLFNSCLAPIDPHNPPDRQQPMEEVLRPVEEVLRMLLLGPQDNAPRRPPPPPNPAALKAEAEQRAAAHQADQARAKASEALEEAKESLEQAAAEADNPRPNSADNMLREAAAELKAVADLAAKAAREAYTPQTKAAAEAAQQQAANAAEAAGKLAGKSAGSPAETAANAQAIKALQNNQLPQLEEKSTAAGLPAQGQLAKAKENLTAALMASNEQMASKQAGLNGAAKALSEAAAQLAAAARKAAERAAAARTPEEKQAAEKAQQKAEAAAKRARELAVLAKGVPDAKGMVELVKGIQDLGSKGLAEAGRHSTAGMVAADKEFEAAQAALKQADGLLAQVVSPAGPGKPLKRAADQFDEAAKAAMEAAEAAAKAKQPDMVKTAAAARDKAVRAGRRARLLAAQAKGELPSDLPVHLAEAARELVKSDLPRIKKLGEEAGADANGTIQDAATALGNAAALLSDGTATKLDAAAASFDKAAEKLDAVQEKAEAAFARSKDADGRHTAEMARLRAKATAQIARNMARMARGQLPANVPGHIVDAVGELVEQEIPEAEAALKRKPGGVMDLSAEEMAVLNNPFLLRTNPKARRDLVTKLGGSANTEDAVKRALDWFTRNQRADGSWDGPRGHDSAATGMAMLSYMGYGAKHTWSKEIEAEFAQTLELMSRTTRDERFIKRNVNPSPDVEPYSPMKDAELTHYQKPLAKAVKWMLKRERDGDLRGPGGNLYDHGIAAIALAEAYSLTKDPLLRKPLERVVAFTVRAQNPNSGGWRYTPFLENPRDRGDLSVTGWQLMALKSAERGGIPVPASAFAGVSKFLNSVGRGRLGGDYRYMPGLEGFAQNPTMVAEGMFCQQLLGMKPDAARMAESAGIVRSNLPRRSQINYYYWYYGSLAMYQQQGADWAEWNRTAQPLLLRYQVRNRGRHDGSWDPIGQWGAPAGRCVTTGFATLSLEVYYRYLPLARANNVNK